MQELEWKRKQSWEAKAPGFRASIAKDDSSYEYAEGAYFAQIRYQKPEGGYDGKTQIFYSAEDAQDWVSYMYESFLSDNLNEENNHEKFYDEDLEVE